jgi:hypothetical protein
MAITVMLTVQGQHANQDSQWLIIENVEGTVGVIRVGSVLIIVVDVNQISLFQMDCVRIVLMVVVYVLDWAVISVKTVLIEHGKYNQH